MAFPDIRTPHIVAACAAALTLPTFAAHPLQTEDTGTQGTANVEIENGFSRAHVAESTISIYQPQISLGITTTVDAILQPSWSSSRTSAQTVSGLGDTNADMKWRFWGSDPWSLALRAGLELPTSQRGLGLQHGDLSTHGLLVATWDAAPLTMHANVGLNRTPSGSGLRNTTGHVSAAAMLQVDDKLILTLDSEIDQDPDPSRGQWPGDALAGLIWTARPGLDLDVGYQMSFHASSFVRQWLAGVTYRFGL